MKKKFITCTLIITLLLMLIGCKNKTTTTNKLTTKPIVTDLTTDSVTTTKDNVTTTKDNVTTEKLDDVKAETKEIVFTSDSFANKQGYTFTPSRDAFGYDSNKSAVQFTQADGAVTISSSETFENVTCIKLTVSTNQSLGMKISVKVGSTALIPVNGANNVDNTLEGQAAFVTTEKLTGVISITLTPNASKKSMYIGGLTVTLNGEIGNADAVKTYMPMQTYDAARHNNDNLQDRLLDYEGAIGLPSIGNYHALVIPVQIGSSTITEAMLQKLNVAFNGDSSSTGYESVSSYYNKSSYGKLNITFDIAETYVASHDASYYNSYQKEIGSGDDAYTQYGDEVIMLEALSYLDPKMDLSIYDTNNDDTIDAVYLIYSEAVDYDNDESLYWAYTTWYYGDKKFDGKDIYYYLFAGFDFMDEDADSEDGFEYGGIIDGLKVNACTYIHESGHLLGLDDYYDYAAGLGADEGLGYADMMDATVGDHNAYSKLMMGWVTPVVATNSGDYTINAFESSGDCVIILLDYDGSYFCEYLIIELYSKTGLNQMHGDVENSYLYYGAEYGVKILHVTSDDSDPYSGTEYSSYTTNNNSDSEYALLKMVEADGETQFESTDGYADECDLFKTGSELKDYRRNDGKYINFTISFIVVSNTSCTFTITFIE